MNRLINYLDRVDTPHSEAFDMPKLLNDFDNFTHNMINDAAKTLSQHFQSWQKPGMTQYNITALTWSDPLS
jgi:hypothetical protein